jgi:PAS domain S-box-containing protein
MTGISARTRQYRIIGALLFLFSLAGFASHISTVLAEGQPQEIRAGVLRNFPPHYSRDEETGQPAGFAIDVMNEVAKNAGLRVRYVVFEGLSFASEALREGRIDVIPNMGIAEERKKDVAFTHPLEAFDIRIFVRETTADIRGLDDLRGRNVAVLADSLSLIMREYGKGKPVIFQSLDESLLSLLSGNTDALVYPEPPVLLITRKTGLEARIKAVGKPLRESKRAMAVGKGKTELLGKLDKAVQAFIATPKYREIYTKWYVAPKPYWNVRRVSIVAGILLALIVGILAAGHYFSLRRMNRGLKSALERQKKAEASLRESEMRYRHLVESSHDWIWEVDESGVYTYASPRVKELLGYEPGEVIGKTPFDLMPDDEARRVKQLFSALAAERRPFRNLENYNRHKDGTPVILETNGTPIIDDNGVFLGYRGTDRDITERKRAEEDRLRLAAAIEQSGEMVVMTDKEGIIQYVNPAFEHITGYGCDEAAGKNPRILKSSKQGIDFYKELWDTLTAGGTWKGRFVNKKKDGSLFEEEATISPVRNLSGDVTHYVAVKRDVTEQLRTEKQLHQAQKMEAIGTMAGGIAHDFNNILGAISGYTELSLTKIPDDSRIKHYLEQINAACRRAINLVRQILEFSRLTEKERTPISLIPLIKETIKMLREIIPSTIEIRLNAKADTDTILGDATQLYQILMNLCTNAYQAMKDKGGLLEVELVGIEVGAGGDIDDKLRGLNPGSYLELIVRDTGDGIDPVTMKRIFDPFFTTKKIGEGTGLGLSVVHGIVRSYGGKITVESRIGEGSAFHIYFPLIFEKPEASTKEPDGPAMNGRGRILLVDDETMLAGVMKERLEDRGYTVIARIDSVDALETFRADPQRFDLVITDQTMPEMTGIDLAGNIMSIRPDLPVILCTGFINSAIEEKTMAAGIRAIVLKPISMKRLISLIRDLLVPAR